MAGQIGKSDRRRGLQGWWMWLALIPAAFALRLYDLGGPEFWFDEALTANVSGLGWAGAIAHLRSAPFEHPPFYFLLLYPWQRLTGTTEFAFRFFSVFWGVLFIPLLYAFVKRLAGERLGRIVAVLATISPFLVTHSQEARMYTLLPCLALLVVLSLLNALDGRKHPGWWAIYALLMTVALATHYLFALMWVAITGYLLWEWPHRHRRVMWGLVLQFSILAVGVVWLLAAPGLRSSLVRLFQGEALFSLGYKLNKIMPALLVLESGAAEIPVAAYIFMAGGWLLVLLGVWWSRRSRMLAPHAWRLLMLLLVIPLAVSLLLPYGVLGRQLGFTLIAVLPFVGLGLLALKDRSRWWLSAGIVLVLLFSSYGLVVQYREGNGDFSQALAYVDEHGQPGDLLILNQPDQRHALEYYNDRAWPVRYVPEPGAPLPAPEQLGDTLSSIAEAHPRLWLGPIGAWTADPEHLVERWLAANTFQAEKVWFPASSFAALYFTGDQVLAPVETVPITWGGRVQLEQLQAGPLQASPNDAVRLRFDWRSVLDLDERYVADLSLVDDRGVVWAERRSEPCSGWCPTDTWAAGQRYQDQHALLIPPGTPPGTYHLQVAWMPLDGETPLPAEGDQGTVDRVTVADVKVLPSTAAVAQPGSVPNPLQATFGDQITLLGYKVASQQAKPGEMLHLETYWRAETQPAGDYELVAELTDHRGHTVANWQVAPSASFFPTSAWQSGEYVRGQHDLRLPQTLSPGHYDLRLALASPSGERLPLSGQRPQKAAGLISWQERLEGQELAVTELRLLDRPRRFDLPAISHALEAQVGQRARLVGYDLDLSQAIPGGQLPLTLYWQASGPMAQPFKVFTHLEDSQGKSWAQHDAQPGEGCCPTDTWADGEVIVDRHTIPLSADLLPGTYQLVVGMYDEGTLNRVPAFGADGAQLPSDAIPISAVTIEPAQAPTP